MVVIWHPHVTTSFPSIICVKVASAVKTAVQTAVKTAIKTSLHKSVRFGSNRARQCRRKHSGAWYGSVPATHLPGCVASVTDKLLACRIWDQQWPKILLFSCSVKLTESRRTVVGTVVSSARRDGPPTAIGTVVLTAVSTTVSTAASIVVSSYVQSRQIIFS